MTRTLPDVVDLVVVGSGPVGSAFARAVREKLPTATVLLVEAGPQLTEPPGMNIRNLPAADRVRPQRLSEGLKSRTGGGPESAVVARPGTELISFTPAGMSLQEDMPAAAISTNVGGMGAHWTCAVPRPGDSERIDFIDPAELDAAFDQAENYLGATADGFEPSGASKLILERLTEIMARGGTGERPVQPMPLACRPLGTGRLPRWAGADVVLGPLVAGAPGFNLADRTLCRRVLVEGDRAIGVELQDLMNGTVSTVRAAAVVVAADALRTPQVLWASGVRPTALGRYLNDQPQIVAALYLNGAEGAEVGEPQEGETDERDNLTGVCWVPFSDRHPFHVQVMQMEASPIQIGAADPFERRPVVGVGFFCAKPGRADDRVELSDTDTDEYGMPAITIHYRLDEQDMSTVAAADNSLRSIAARLGDYVPGGEPALLPAGSSLHYQGSTRMGRTRDDDTSVCDSRSKVWGYRNLYVGGNGVIPTPTACNPTLTSVALAIRAADDIVDRIKAHSEATAPAGSLRV